MTARTIVRPVVVIKCDHKPFCDKTFRADRPYDQSSANLARWAARAADWSVRPAFGKGMRTAPDLCPTHKPVSS